MKAQVPSLDCSLCPRLVDFRTENRRQYPDYHNAPVAAFGPDDAQLLILGLAPGLKGANCTGRPFTGDYAGDLLYATLKKFNLAEGNYEKRSDDGLTLRGCRIVNAVRCVPPANKPTTDEIRTCNSFLASELESLKQLTVVVALGRVAHDALLMASGLKRSHFKFEHAAVHDLQKGVQLVDSYHCSRYNTNTGRLTETMFHDVFAKAQKLLSEKTES
ncbi:uracil-DNA glycosylase [Fodinicurvata fenggangensis]|uniref:uracil-DNA glycosylase n=1 Tax=Fodinicurvata fenggangensis TaxID=1121830 RepID=UPI00047D5BD4|nr:uracil-DNA glycosylase [Fodinicurvata fenggangensis]